MQPIARILGRASQPLWVRLLLAAVVLWVLALVSGAFREAHDFYGGRFYDETGRYGKAATALERFLDRQPVDPRSLRGASAPRAPLYPPLRPIPGGQAPLRPGQRHSHSPPAQPRRALVQDSPKPLQLLTVIFLEPCGPGTSLHGAINTCLHHMSSTFIGWLGYVIRRRVSSVRSYTALPVCRPSPSRREIVTDAVAVVRVVL